LGLQENENAIMDAFKKNGSRISLKGTNLSVGDESGLKDSFKNVDVVFCPNPPKHSAIEFNVKGAKDKKRYDDYNFDNKYYSKEPVEMEFKDVSDHQTKKGIFYLKLEDSDHTLFFDVKTKI
jgi:hypothetical protein